MSGENEELNGDAFSESGVTIVILSLMIMFSILFEKAREEIEERTPATLKPIINSLFGELTLLGFIGLVLFIVSKLKLVQTLSQDIFGEDGAINELSESVHMGLFLVMLIFLATVLLLVQFGTEIVARWQEWEDCILAEADVRERFHSIVHREHGAESALASLHHAILGLEPDEFQETAYAALRKEFLAGPPVLDSHFDFAEYLEPRLGHVLAEFVEIPVSTWIMLEGFLLFIWLVIIGTSKFFQTLLYLSIGYALPLTLRAVHGKLRHIKTDTTIMGGQLHHFLHEHRKTLQQEGNAEGTPLLKPVSSPAIEVGGQAELTIDEVVEGQKQMKRRNSQPPKHFSSFVVPKRYDPDSLIAHYGISEIEAKEHYKRFWFGERYKATFMHSIIRSCLLVNAIYLAIFFLMFLPGILSEEAGLSWGSIALLVPLTVLPSMILINMTSDVVQDFTLVTSIHSMKNNRIIEQAVRRMKTRFAFLALKVMYMMINGTKRDRARAEAGGAKSAMAVWRQEQARKNAVRTKLKSKIKAVTTAQKFILESSSVPLTSRHSPPPIHIDDTVSDSDGKNITPKAEARKKRQAVEALAMRQERVWNEIFRVFDHDGGGTISRDELKVAISKMAPPNSVNDADLEYMLEELDENHDGEISFEEFYSYSQYIMSSITTEQTEEEIAEGMFKLIDRGEETIFDYPSVEIAEEKEIAESEATISIPELQAALRNCGQELSADDAYNVIRDIDEDGDGQLNHEEFQTLLEKLNVI